MVRELEIRPMRAEDVTEVNISAYNSLREMAKRYSFEDWPEVGERKPDRIVASEYRMRHILAHDPAGSWVATHDGVIEGVALATKRDSLWFLSLLTVSSALQGAGVGKRLLDAALAYAQGCDGAWIMSSVDPKALHLYHQAGFVMHPGYDVRGKVDRSLLEPTAGVVVGDWDKDADFVDDLAREVRGAAFGVDQQAFKQHEFQLLKIEQGGERGIAVLGPGELWNVAATSPQLGYQLVMEAAALTKDDEELGYGALTSSQQWAIDVAMALRLTFSVGTSLCVRGKMGTMSAYLGNGAYG